jgi:hypothetical protein
MAKAVQQKPDEITSQLLGAVRSVGTFKPKFSPREGKLFSDELSVLGTAFWVKDERVLITCAHVIEEITRQPLELAGLLVVGSRGQYQRAIIGSVDYLHDLATLILVDPNSGQPLEQTDPTKFNAEVATGLTTATSYPTTGTSVAWAGYPLGIQLLNQLHDPTYSSGVVGISKREGLFVSLRRRPPCRVRLSDV